MGSNFCGPSFEQLYGHRIVLILILQKSFFFFQFNSLTCSVGARKLVVFSNRSVKQKKKKKLMHDLIVPIKIKNVFNTLIKFRFYLTHHTLLFIFSKKKKRWSQSGRTTKVKAKFKSHRTKERKGKGFLIELLFSYYFDLLNKF